MSQSAKMTTAGDTSRGKQGGMIAAPTKAGPGGPLSSTSGLPPQVAEAALPWEGVATEMLDGGEVVLLATKPSMWRPFFDSLAWIVTSVVFATVMLAWGLTIAGLSQVLSCEIVLFAGLARMAIAIFDWIPRWYVLTNRRILNLRGIRSQVCESVRLVDVQRTVLSQSGLEKLPQIGTIEFQVDHVAGVPVEWRSIPRPEETHARIRKAIENALDNGAF